MDGYSLKLQPYCKDCPEFDVDVNEDVRINNYDIARGPLEDPIKLISRTITCSHAKRCENMIRYLKEKENAKQVNKE